MSSTRTPSIRASITAIITGRGEGLRTSSLRCTSLSSLLQLHAAALPFPASFWSGAMLCSCLESAVENIVESVIEGVV